MSQALNNAPMLYGKGITMLTSWLSMGAGGVISMVLGRWLCILSVEDTHGAFVGYNSSSRVSNFS